MRLGADPEVFLRDQSDNLVSALGRVGGCKFEPKQLEHFPKGYTVQEDNVAIEFGIPPAKTCAGFVNSIHRVMRGGLSIVEPQGLSFTHLSAAVFPKKELKHPLAHQFGCEPDFDVWAMKENDKPKPPVPEFRCAGGHVHMETKEDPVQMGRACDLFMAIPSLIMDKAGGDRRKFYGKPGAIRFKPYGLEYRVLSNFWVFKKKYIEWVWNTAHRAEEFVKTGNEIPAAVPDIILSNNQQLAHYMVKEYDLDVCL